MLYSELQCSEAIHKAVERMGFAEMTEIQEKNLKWDDVLTCSAYASSMGGSQVYLEENETMSVFELFKCIAIASANDAKHIG